MKAIILFNEVGEVDRPDETDVAIQAEAVSSALVANGYDVVRLACPLDLNEVAQQLRLLDPDFVFNIVESAYGSDRFAYLAAGMLEGLGIPYTGTTATAMALCDNKPVAKQLLLSAALPTPEWLVRSGRELRTFPQTSAVDRADDIFIVKPAAEHASLGMTGDSLVPFTELHEKLTELGDGYFAEKFIDGREFNLSLIEIDRSPFVLPPAEIVFDSFPQGMHRIVGYSAKWHSESFEFNNTPRTFEFGDSDGRLLDKLKNIAIRCWNNFNLKGYARIDFRIDKEGNPWILEVNCNPCLSPDAGFQAALNRASITFAEAVEMMVDSAFDPAKTARSVMRDRYQIDNVARTSTENSVRGKAEPAAKPILRREVREQDREAISHILVSAGNFNPEEIEIALELLDDFNRLGTASGYNFIFAEVDDLTVGYICYGPIPLTASSFDIYWIAVLPDRQSLGIGATLMKSCEQAIAADGGHAIYIDTSGRDSYLQARKFYQKNGYRQAVRLTDFYATDDDKVLYRKDLA